MKVVPNNQSKGEQKKQDSEGEWTQALFKSARRVLGRKNHLHIHKNIQTLNMLEMRGNNNDETEQPNYVFDELSKEEAVVDSGAIDCVTSQTHASSESG